MRFAAARRSAALRRGERHEKVYDAAWSGGRKPGSDGKLPSVGNTVDVANATWTNSIGSPELITVWTDPEFDPEVSAAYYARVLEIPTPRWTTYDAFRYDVEIPEGLIVAAILRNGRASTPRGDHRLEVGDDVILFVRRAEAAMAQLLFPGPDSD